MSSEISTVELERLAAHGWRGTSTHRLGEWLLRAGSGFTGRANSVLPLGSAGCGLDQAIAVVADFYAGHAARCAPSRRTCLLYTSDAADEEDSVDLGGRRII